jgi:hypothetical protein
MAEKTKLMNANIGLHGSQLVNGLIEVSPFRKLGTVIFNVLPTAIEVARNDLR